MGILIWSKNNTHPNPSLREGLIYPDTYTNPIMKL